MTLQDRIDGFVAGMNTLTKEYDLELTGDCELYDKQSEEWVGQIIRSMFRSGYRFMPD